jgi:hypothetical protein
MGEQIKLLCSETSPSNNGKDLKDIFINRFKLPDGFWNDLFDINCPEGNVKWSILWLKIDFIYTELNDFIIL